MVPSHYIQTQNTSGASVGSDEGVGGGQSAERGLQLQRENVALRQVVFTVKSNTIDAFRSACSYQKRG
eukprot:640491-Rhodomonas_salina.1